MPVAADDPLAVAEAWMGEGRDLAIATMVAGKGPAALLVGRRLVVDAGGATCGGLGHGPADDAASAQAAAVIATGEPCLLDLALPDGHALIHVERLG